MPPAMPPEISETDIHPAELRFNFLFPVGPHYHKSLRAPRFQLNAPDTLESRWSVFDRHDRVTVGFGATPEAAVDAAITTANARAKEPEAAP